MPVQVMCADDIGADEIGDRTAQRGFPELQFLQEWLGRGYAGEIAYLHRILPARGR